MNPTLSWAIIILLGATLALAMMSGYHANKLQKVIDKQRRLTFLLNLRTQNLYISQEEYSEMVDLARELNNG